MPELNPDLGEGFFDTEIAVASLLHDGVLFVQFERGYSFKGREIGKEAKIDGVSIVLSVICNDIFAWGCSDAEDITYDEVETLYEMVLKDKVWGRTKWVCLKRNEQPQKPIKDAMIEAGAWSEEMEKLGVNQYDELLKKNK